MVSVTGSYGNAWRQLWPNFLMLVGTGIIAALITAPASLMGDAAEAADGLFGYYLAASGIAAWILLSGPIEYGFSYVCLRAARDEEIAFTDIFEGFRNYANSVVTNLPVGLIIIVGFILLILPGIVLTCRLSMTPYLVVDERMSATDAIQESWAMTRGFGWTVFCMALLAIPLALLGLLALGVGIIVAIIWISVAFASLYLLLSEEIDRGADYSPSA